MNLWTANKEDIANAHDDLANLHQRLRNTSVLDIVAEHHENMADRLRGEAQVWREMSDHIFDSKMGRARQQPAIPE